MRSITLIGIGTGNPAHMTVQGIEALAGSDVVFIPTKGEEKARLAAVRRDIVDRFATQAPRLVEFALPVRDTGRASYVKGVADWHDAIALEYEQMIGAMGPHERAALLVWGDPGLYDSSLRILDRVARTVPLAVEVVAGITAIQALTAAFAIPLNTVGNAVTITTGRRLIEDGWPTGTDTLVVMLDGGKSYGRIDPAGIDIYWAAYAGMPEQILISGPLADVRDTIAAARDGARAEHGWIMDIYLLRKTG